MKYEWEDILLLPWRLVWAVPAYIGRAIFTASIFMMWGPRRAKKLWRETA